MDLSEQLVFREAIFQNSLSRISFAHLKFVVKIFKFLSWLFDHAEDWLHKRNKVNFKVCDATTCLTYNYNTHFYFTLVPRPFWDFIRESTLSWQVSYRHAVKKLASSKKAETWWNLDAVRWLIELRGFHLSALTSGDRRSDAATSDKEK